ncbi:WSC domain-containing protein [Colletotrichum graminicola M1.001]|uniref:WSC domain-containing protein n=1 Tax=Colletotrichum graminicola (strain M1.001 / M2 / FGSC 10212) TaxID=645133 RepID=E3Q5V5_COLGM|nr:WSC domain-containing protein [Colletotrichum graminicola M1.001]EFQ26203.1 WSC domain-containing protein [Colletotrichum graminicola M1.001]
MRTTQMSFAFLSTFALVNAAATPPSIYRRAPAPPTLANGYAYQGCYVDVGRTISAAQTANGQMSNDACTAYCFSKGFAYAGTEYANECYCGNSLAKGGVLANEADCTSVCSGDATQPCGGPNRLSLYKTSQITGPSVNPGVGDWSSIGCYAEGTTGRALTYGVGTVPAGQMTVAKCTAACAAANFILAGVEYSGECCKSTLQYNKP